MFLLLTAFSLFLFFLIFFFLTHDFAYVTASQQLHLLATTHKTASLLY